MPKRDPLWLKRQHTDRYFRQSKVDAYRSRAAYKLMEIDTRERLFRLNQRVVDVGAAPGSWSAYTAKQVGAGGVVVAVDILPIKPITGVNILIADILADTTRALVQEQLGGYQADVVICDISPNISGVRAVDQANSLELIIGMLSLAACLLKKKGDLLLKVFQGEGVVEIQDQLIGDFARLETCKPAASRQNSREFYWLARSFKGKEKQNALRA